MEATGTSDTSVKTQSVLRVIAIQTTAHGTTRLPLEGFSPLLIFEYFSKTLLQKFKVPYNLTRITDILQKTYVFIA